MAFQKENVIIGRGNLNTYATPNGLILHTYFSAVDTHTTMETAGYFGDFLGATAEDVLIGDLIWARDSSNAFRSYRIDAVAPMAITPVSVDSPQNPFDQTLNTTDAVTFTTVNTGQGANELFPMDQGVRTIDSPTFDTTTTTTGFVMPTAGGTPAVLDYYEKGSFVWTWTGGFTGTINQTVDFVRLGDIVVLAFDSVTVAQTGAAIASSGTELPVRLRTGMQYAFYNPSVVDNTVPINARFLLQADGSATYSKEDGSAFSGTGNLQLQESTVTYLIV